MTSTATPLGFNLQGDGDNANTWGDTLNTGVFALADEAIRGIYSAALSGTVTLDATNFVSNEARRAILNITSGTGGTIIIPDVSKLYVVINGASGDVTVKGSGTGAVVKAGEVCQVVSDATTVKRVQPTDYGAQKITSVADPTNAQDAATKNYVDAAAFATQSGSYPGQTGNEGKFLTTDGANPSWGSAVSAGGGLAAVVGATLTVAAAPSADVRTGTTKAEAMTPGDTYDAFAEVTLFLNGSNNVVTGSTSGTGLDMGAFINGTITLGANATLPNPTNHKIGQTGWIRFVQDGTGSSTLTVASDWKRVGGALALTTTPSATDVLVYQVITSTLIVYDILRNPS